MANERAGTGTLRLAGQPYPVQSAELYVGRPTRWPRRATDDIGVAFGLSLRVDDESGEDGAPAPMIQNIPLVEAFGRWPRPDELPGMTVAVENDVLWDAWYGNDAEPLNGNRLKFGSWSGNFIHVQWSAHWDRYREEPGILSFDGAAVLSQIRLNIFDDESVEALVTAIWGANAIAHFHITRIPKMPVQGPPIHRPRGMPDTVSYQLWPTFLGPRPT